MKLIGITYLDCCLSCYFQGFSGDVLCFPAHGGMTVKDVREALENEWLANDYEGESLDFTQALNELCDGPEDKIVWPRLEPIDEQEDCAESVYAYFGIMRDKS